MNLSRLNHHRILEAIVGYIIQDFISAMKQRGLSVPQVHALMLIYHGGECHVSDIGAMTGVSNAAASQMVERMVQQGLMERLEDPENRRKKILRLTEKGIAMIRESIPFENFLKELTASLTAEQRRTVKAAISILAGKVANSPYMRKVGQHE